MSSRDPPVPLERVLEQTGWARALARRLVHDDALSEDLVQEMILRAMRTPPGRAESVRGWIRTVLRNLVHSDWRSRTARSAREAAVGARPDTPTPDEVHERLELHREVAAAVAGLDRDLAEVVYLRYHEALMPQQIAERLGIAVPTVHGRLRRAHAALRIRLRDRAEERGTSLTGFLGPLLAGFPDPAPVGAAPRERSRGLRPVYVGTAALVLVGVAAWVGLGGGGSGTGPTAVPDSGTTASRSGGASRAARGRAAADATGATADAAESGAASSAAAPASGTASSARRVRPFDVRLDGAPAAGTVRVTWWPVLADPSLVRAEDREAQAADGRLALDLGGLGTPSNPLRAIDVVAADPEYLPVPVRVPVRDWNAADPEPRAGLFRAAHVTGRLVATTPTAQIRVATVRFAPGRAQGLVVDAADVAPDQPYRLRAWPGEEQWIVAVADGHAPVAFRFRTDAEFDAGTHALEPGAAAQGTVRGADGAPPPATGTVEVTDETVSTRFVALGPAVVALDGDAARLQSASVRADASGGWSLGGFRSAPHRVRLVGVGMSGDVANRVTRRVVLPAADVALEFSGTPIDVEVPESALGRLLQISQDVPPSTAIRVTGRVCRFLADPRMRYELSLSTESRQQWVGVAAPAEGDVPRRVALRRADVPPGPGSRVEFRVPPGAEVAGLVVALHSRTGGMDDRQTLRTARVDVVGGMAELDLEQTGPHRLVVTPYAVSPARTDFLLDHQADVELSPDAPQTVQVDVREGGRMTLIVRDARGLPAGGKVRLLRDGTPVAASFTSRVRGFAPGPDSTLSASGVTESYSAIPPGSYVVEVTSSDGTVRTAPVTIETRRESLVEITLP